MKKLLSGLVAFAALLCSAGGLAAAFALVDTVPKAGVASGPDAAFTYTLNSPTDCEVSITPPERETDSGAGYWLASPNTKGVVQYDMRGLPQGASYVSGSGSIMLHAYDPNTGEPAQLTQGPITLTLQVSTIAVVGKLSQNKLTPTESEPSTTTGFVGPNGAILVTLNMQAGQALTNAAGGFINLDFSQMSLSSSVIIASQLSFDSASESGSLGYTISNVPEPSTIYMAGVFLAVLMAIYVKKTKQKSPRIKFGDISKNDKRRVAN